MYLGQTPPVAVLETFGHATGTRLIMEHELRVRGLAQITARRRLRLVDLTGPGLAQLGADGRLAAGDSYDISQAWTLAIFNHPSNVDGILYRARHDPELRCAAIFDRAAAILECMVIGAWSDPHLRDVLAKILDRYGFGLV